MAADIHKGEVSVGHGLGRPGEHTALFYDSDPQLSRAVARFAGEGLGAGVTVCLIARNHLFNSVCTILGENGFNVDSLLKRRRLRYFDVTVWKDAILQPGIDPIEWFVGQLALALEGTEAEVPRLYGELSSSLIALGNSDLAMRIEEAGNDYLVEHEAAFLCAYPLTMLDHEISRDDLHLLCQKHSCILGAESKAVVSDELRSILELRQRADSLEAEVASHRITERNLRDQTRALRILQRIAADLARQNDPEQAVTLVIEGGLELTGASFGAFFHDAQEGDRIYTLYTLAGVPPEAFSQFPMPRRTALFAPTFEEQQVVRIADVGEDPRHGQNAPYNGLPPGHLPVRSYLAVPVKTRTGKVFGSLLFGHGDPDVFNESAEEMAISLADHAALALENANLTAALQREVISLQSAQTKSRRLASIVHSSEDAIISKDLDGNIRTWNRGAELIFGYAAEEIIGSPITRLFPPHLLPEEDAIMARIRSGQQVEHYETVRMRKDGTPVDISLSISPVLDENGKVVGAAKIGRDISERKRQEAELQRANLELRRIRDELELRVEERTASLREAISQVEEFSYTVSHDLRAPLRATSVYCDVLLNEHRTLIERDADALRCVQRIADSTARLDQMIRDVLAFGRVSKNEISMSPVNLDSLITDIISHSPNLQSPSATVTVHPLGEVLGHAPSLTQVLSNLLNNAVKFMPEGQSPVVAIWADRREDRVRIWVKDNGIGIAPEHHSRLFGIFERIHPKLPYEGSGVGLAIVRRAAERMGGAVGVESDGQHGSQFWVELATV